MTRDLRLAWRSIVRAPSYAAMVIGSLAIGIAAPILAFSIMNAALLRPLEGVPDQDRLVRIGLTGQRGEQWVMGSTYALYASLRDELRHLTTLAAAIPINVVLSRDRGEPTTLNGEIVSANYFEMLELRPETGAFFGSAPAADADRVVVISHDVWRRQFQLAPNVIGQFVLVNGTPLQVVGVTQERFDGLTGENAHVWLPFRAASLALRRDGLPATIETVRAADFSFVGRLNPNISIPQLESAASPIVYRAADGAQDRTSGADRLSEQLIARFGTAPVGADVTKYWRGGRGAPTWYELGTVIAAAMALPFLVLAIACVNAGNLVLARATRAIHVWNMQLALGASRSRLLRQPVVEGLMLAVPAAAAGLLLTRWGFIAIEPLIPFHPLIDWRVVVFAIATAAITPLLFGVGPTWAVLSRAHGLPPGHLSQPVTRSRARTALLIVQATLSLALLGTGTQWIRTVRDGFGDGLGLGDRMLVASVDVDKLGLTRDAVDRYYTTLLARVKEVPGALRAATLAGLPDLTRAVPREGQTAVWVPGDPPDKSRGALIAYVTADIFSALGIPLISGRPFHADEHAGRLRSVIVNEPFITRHLVGNPIGQTVRLHPRDQTTRTALYSDGQDAIIVGVVRAAAGRRNDSLPTVFAPVPAVLLPARTIYIPVTSAGTMRAAIPAIREAIRSVDPRVPFTLSTLDDRRWSRSEPRRFMAVAMAILGSLALILAGVGLYGAISYAVELRTREIGVRIAVGATSRSVLRIIVREAMALAAIASLLGTAGAAAVSVIVRSTMYGTSTVDPIAFGSTIVLLLMTMLVASIVPAARAARIDPVAAIRAE